MSRAKSLFAVPFLAALAVAGSGAAPASAQDGAQAFRKDCFVCHETEAGKNKVGPSLAGVVGRAAGTAPGYTYSAAMAKAGLTWDEKTLDQYLTDPRSFIPSNKMLFLGVKNADERHAIIQYLATLKAPS